MKSRKWLTLGALVLLTASVYAADEQALRETLTKKMPGVTIGTITRTPYGLYEVVANGYNVFYTDATGTVGFFGKMVELESKKNLTEARQQDLMFVDFSTLPLDKAIKKVKGDGSRKLVVFSDPECPYCKQLERELLAVDNVTIYVFLYPIASLHPDAPRKAQLVWCAPDRARAWDDLMIFGRLPEGKGDCATPIDDIAALAERLYINGTPGMVFQDGRLVPGVASSQQIETLLQASAPKAANPQGGLPETTRRGG